MVDAVGVGRHAGRAVAHHHAPDGLSVGVGELPVEVFANGGLHLDLRIVDFAAAFAALILFYAAAYGEEGCQ